MRRDRTRLIETVGKQTDAGPDLVRAVAGRSDRQILQAIRLTRARCSERQQAT